MDEHLPDQNDEAQDSLVLVVVMNSRRDWEIVQRERWYRLPAKRATRQIGAEYLAFYHTSAFDEEKWSVRHYAPVRAVRVALRRELLPAEADHPRAGDLYYRFDLGPLERLDRPVPSRRLRRIAFIHTTLERLLEAQDVAELWLAQPLRERLWIEFSRQGIHAERVPAVREGESPYAFDFVIPCYKGGVAINCIAAAGEPGAPSFSEADATYPESGKALEQTNWSWLRFEDAGSPVRLEPYLEQVWREIERRGGQM